MFSLPALGNIGEFVGAIAVVVSLIYLARQTIHNTRSVQAASFNAMVQNSIRLLEHSFRDSEFATFYERAERDPEALSPDEKIRWDSYMTSVFRHFGNLIYQQRVGALDDQMWEAYRETLKQHLRVPSWGITVGTAKSSARHSPNKLSDLSRRSKQRWPIRLDVGLVTQICECDIRGSSLLE